MRRSVQKQVIVLLLLLLSVYAQSASAADCVIILHGLARTERSMHKMEDALVEKGYRVVNQSYPSRSATVQQLSAPTIEPRLQQCRGADKVHFVTHSMGGILLRYYLNNHHIDNLGRTVMLAPPNQGSEVVDTLDTFPGFEELNGPAGMQLGTDAQAIPQRLGPVDFDLGIIAGTQTINVILSLYLPNPDDGKVSVSRTKVEGMHDHLVLPVTHAMMMQNPEVIAQVIYYLDNGYFSR